MKNRSMFSGTQLRLLIALLSIGAVGVALVLQYQFNMQPCPWCTMQRLVYLCIGVLALISLQFSWLSKDMLSKAVLSLALLLCASGVGMAGYQHFVAAQSECMFTWPDRFFLKTGLDGLAPWLFRATAQCSEANQPLLGLPFSWWSAALFVALGIGVITAIRQR
jgi:protein dithiol:quinone oxidoreductase